MSPTGAGWPRWLLITLLVVAVALLVPLGWMLCAMTFGAGMMGGMGPDLMGDGMMDGSMMGMHWAGLVGLALLVALLIALVLLVLSQLSRGKTDESARS
ncbi:MAG TPA: hypothetical protein VMT85_14225 [Thermoanaerobaculia bacterium]|nr:hypothetical protein [Thermoanaerobaculia bacterium]